MCAALKVSRGGYYARKGRRTPVRATAHEQFGVEIVALHPRSRGTAGSPRVQAELRAKDRRVSKKRVARVMRERKLVARRKRQLRRTMDSNHDSLIAPNVLERNFEQGTPNMAW